MHKNHPRRTIDQSIRAKTIKFPEENITQNLFDLELGKDVLETTQNIKPREEKVDKFNFIKMKNSCTSKDRVFLKRKRKKKI